jgi:phage repressor protein C with HTH and peptisase S24 domain
MDPDLGQRLKAYRHRVNISMTTIANETGISRENLYKWERGSKPSNIRDYTVLKNYLDRKEGLEQTLESDPKITSIRPATVFIPFDPNKIATFQHSGNMAAGTIINTDDQHGFIADRIDAPFLGDVDGTIEVTGDSMEPTLKNGWRVAISRLIDNRLLNWGACYYIIDRNLQGIVRRIYPATEETIRLIADHTDQSKYPPITRQWNDIEAVFKVKAAILKL